MFQMASRRKRGGSDIDSTFAKWKKILQEVPSTKLSDDSQILDCLDGKLINIENFTYVVAFP